MIKILPCIDSIEVSTARRRELDIPPETASARHGQPGRLQTRSLGQLGRRSFGTVTGPSNAGYAASN